MADDENTEEEPSIEEILDSIRQIISDEDDDGDDSAPVETPKEPEEEIAAAPFDPEEDIIELKDPVDEPEDKPEPEPDPVVEEPPEPESIEDIFGDTSEDEDDFDLPDMTAEPDRVDIEMSGDNDDNILRGAAESAATQGFEKLVKQTSVEYNGITLEEIVRTELKPLLREWLDEHLPHMIERLVKEELERVSKSVIGDY